MIFSVSLLALAEITQPYMRLNKWRYFLLWSSINHKVTSMLTFTFALMLSLKLRDYESRRAQMPMNKATIFKRYNTVYWNEIRKLYGIYFRLLYLHDPNPSAKLSDFALKNMTYFWWIKFSKLIYRTPSVSAPAYY